MRTPGVRAAAALSLALLAMRWHLAGLVGFGDAEALYACYALHPQPAYLEHPGLVGQIARLVGGGGAPSPVAAHRFTAIAATLVPVVAGLAARAAGATPAGALRAFFAVALLPEITIGLFGLTPDLPLAATWLATVGCGALYLRSAPGTRGALLGAVAGGFFAGLAVTAKASGALVALAFVTALASRAARGHLRTAAPWCAIATLGIVVAPVVAWEIGHGLPMLEHRFVTTQGRAGFSLRNLGALVGGQLLYATPPFLAGAALVFRETWRRREDPVDRWLAATTLIAAVPLVLLGLWSRVAEPHWVAPAYLALAVAAGRASPPGRLVARSAIGVGVAAPLLAWVLVATPLWPRLAGERYVPKYDLANDLFAWRAGLPLVGEALAHAAGQSREPVIVGAHWTIAAQVHAALGRAVPVGSLQPSSEFSRWLPENEWRRAATILLVTDDRFEPGPPALPSHDVVSVQTARVYRGGRVVRTIRVTRLDRAAVAQRAGEASYSAAAGSAVRPAAASSSESPSGPGFGVVSRRSP